LKRRVCCLLLGLSILCLPVQQVYAAPAGPAAQEHPKPHEHKKPVPPHEKEHPKPHEKEKPVPLHEKKDHPKPHEEKKGPLAEKPVPPNPEEKPIPPHEKEKPEAEDKQPESTPTATPVPTVAPKQETEDTTTSVAGSELVKYALQFVGNPYKYGGTSLTNGADCSGFVQSVFAHFDYSLERTSSSQAKTAGYTDVSLKESDLQPGDLIFYANSRGSVYHVAIYIGDGKIVHASNNRKEITISEYDGIKPYKARRIIA